MRLRTTTGRGTQRPHFRTRRDCYYGCTSSPKFPIPRGCFPEDKWSESQRIACFRFPCRVSQRMSRLPEDKWSDSQRIKSFPEGGMSVSQRIKCPFSHETFWDVPFPIVPFPRLYKCRYLSFLKPLSWYFLCQTICFILFFLFIWQLSNNTASAFTIYFIYLIKIL